MLAASSIPLSWVSIGCDRHNPRINWDDLTIVFQSEYCQDNCTATQPVTCHSVEMTTCSTSRTDPDKLTSQVYPYIGGNEQQISDFPQELTIEYADVFSKSNANKLPAHSEFDFGIDLEPGFHPPHGKVYSLTPKETQVMATYVQEQLDKEFIRPSTSPAAAPCFFVAKKDGDLRPRPRLPWIKCRYYQEKISAATDFGSSKGSVKRKCIHYARLA
ncbi:hypothetical protein BASA83_006553 [Batrachochytrium salamandrivorans]|nr:hypothetical protein BASA83_006553 [Batrachochytrium salamandrivorans]